MGPAICASRGVSAVGEASLKSVEWLEAVSSRLELPRDPVRVATAL